MQGKKCVRSRIRTYEITELESAALDHSAILTRCTYEILKAISPDLCPFLGMYNFSILQF